jgi:formate hydrogenlyase transcriptional activator
MLAVDRRARVVQLNAAAERLLTVRRPSGGQTLRDELGPVVEAALERGGGHPEGYEQTIGSRALGGQVRIVTLPVFRDRRPIGAIVVLPLGEAGRLAEPGPRMRAENLALREEVDQASMFEEIVGTSPPFQALLADVSRVAPTNSTVLITGETGTGKELVARAIHKRSSRSSRAFVSVNCAAIPQTLIASELFGHEKGAFTGALTRHLGRFELADGGTIFLDEIGDLPPDTQLALLRVLQEREFERLGATRPTKVDVRVIAATNRDLQDAMANGAFRADLFYRLSVFPIEMPALRERTGDIPLLVAYFVDRYASKAGKTIRRIEERTLDLVQSYRWPGNIRELQNVIERAVIVCQTDTLVVDENWFAPESLAAKPPVLPLGDALVAREREMIEAALAETKGKVSGPSGAAARLGIPGSTLESRIRALKIRKSQYKGP